MVDKADKGYREPPDSCESCVKLAKQVGEYEQRLGTTRVRSTWQVLGAGIIAGGMVFSGLSVHGILSRPPGPPEPPALCVDAVTVISAGSEYKCAPGARLFADPITQSGLSDNARVVVRCVCDQAPSAPPGAR